MPIPQSSGADSAAHQHLYDVFLSHHSGDKPLVESIAARLIDEQGLRPFLDKWHLIPGEPWQEALEEALDQSGTCAVFLGPSGLGPWENEEMRVGLDERVRNKSFRVIPVLLPRAEPKDKKTLPRFLSRLTWVDFRGGLDDPDAFQRLAAGIRGLPPGRQLALSENQARQLRIDKKAVAKTGRARWQVLESTLIGALIVIFLVGLQLICEHYALECGSRLRIYEWLQTRLNSVAPSNDLRVTLVDISGLPGGQNERQMTDRSSLWKIVKAIESHHPRAIAIDIDFSPLDDQLEAQQLSKQEQQFLDDCLTLSNNNKVPIFLGVHRQVGSRSDFWLGASKYKSMAAATAVNVSDNCRAPIWIKGVSEKIHSLGWAAAGSPTVEAPHWLAWAIQIGSYHQPKPYFEYADRVISYANLEEIRKRRIEVKDGTPIAQASADRFRDRIVVIGDATNSYDQFLPPGRTDPWPGVFLHACAADTFARSPVYEARPLARLVLDISIALVVFGLLSYFRFHGANKKDGFYLILRSMRAMVIIAVVISAAGGLLAILLSLLWLDFFALAVAVPIDHLVLNKLRKGNPK